MLKALAAVILIGVWSLSPPIPPAFATVMGPVKAVVSSLNIIVLFPAETRRYFRILILSPAAGAAITAVVVAELMSTLARDASVLPADDP